MKTCFVCKERLPLHRQRFCSEACSYYHTIETAKRRRRKLKLDPINCSICGKTLIPKTTRQRYCNHNCWTVEQIRRRDIKRKLIPKEPKERRAKRFEATWCSPAFGERKVKIAEHTRADSKERMEIQSAVEEYLKNGGEITRYGDQVAKIEVEGEIKWQIDRSEERDIQAELAHLWGLDNVLGN
jgi:predicted nucleic acid-binding Zn ribbon protein